MSFAQEVRRTTPFVPVLAGRALHRADLGDVEVRRGDRLILDVIGIDHDPRRWPDPDRFEAERFRELSPAAYDLVPQGGGHPSGHRCPGESLTLRLLETTLRVLLEADAGDDRPARVDRRRRPTVPRKQAGPG